jgi:hypothetical protein
MLHFPVGHMVKPLIKSGASSLLLLLVSLTFYCFTRGLALLSPIDYSAYDLEFSDISQEYIAAGWLVAGVVLTYALLTTNLYAWRVGLLLCSIGFATWAVLLIANRSFRVFDGIMTYCFLAICTFTIAIRSDDPRPLKLLKDQVNDRRDSSSTSRPN